MSNAFKKKKQESSADSLKDKLNFLLGSQLIEPSKESTTTLSRSLILKSAMFWDSKSRIERIKSLVLSNLNLQQFDNVDDFKIEELASISLLSLSKNNIIHLQPIANLDTLVTLNINQNRIYNLSPLEGLMRLEELYASNNLITNISSLGCLGELRLLNLFRNKIGNFEHSFKTLQKMGKLIDLDVEENPFYDQQVRKELICLPITRLNDQLISKSEKDSHLSSNKSIINMASSCVITPLNVSMMRDTKTSFFNPSTKSIKRHKIKQLKQQLEHLQEQYSKIDDEFQEEIVKNVQLKTQYHHMLQAVQKAEEHKEDNQYKSQEIKLLKRKSKDLKENLFTKDAKGELLRKLFQLETKSAPKKTQKKQIKKVIAWTRKFDSDDVIIIENDNKYLEEDRQLAELLQNNSSALEELRRQLQSFY